MEQESTETAAQVTRLRPAPPAGEGDGTAPRMKGPSPEDAAPLAGAGQGGAQPGFFRRHARSAAVASVLLPVLFAGGYLYWEHSNHFETTDDAFIAARQIAIAPRVSGDIVAVPVTDNQHVTTGDVIVRIDDRDFRAALLQADAQVAAAQASIAAIDAQLAVQQSQIAQNQAQVDQAHAALTFAQEQAVRYADLARRGYGPEQTAEQTSSQLSQQQAALRTAEAALDAARRQVQALTAQRAGATASLQQATAQQTQARLNLSYTTITAAEPGRVVALTAGVGEYVAAGTSLTMFVPDEIWVTANFKETQLDRMRPGQAAALEVDAYPGRDLQGHVDSVQPGSGTAFSLLPAQNATGNYVKITQRVPVKIGIDNAPTDVALGPGMSVVPTVRVDPTPSLYERLRQWL
ncbi:HlyD family secretion protein [Roseomonas sp. HJA6]|uniref:HlyD family secretion protein n=1 Tax=Roseomonas alba TaxID=2846776 RepID=A0ABS7A3N3_9PROT|nr:HlyD family secretion protein [Neoroseomonas alba]MBW6396899.1 HlyD family secretion protein [Neoroseomonas alba]